MKFKTHNECFIHIGGTALQGYIQGTRESIMMAFGDPMVMLHGDDVKQAWDIIFSGGQVATIYDWRCDVTPVNGEIYAWHIGAHSRDVVAMVHEAFRLKNELKSCTRKLQSA